MIVVTRRASRNALRSLLLCNAASMLAVACAGDGPSEMRLNEPLFVEAGVATHTQPTTADDRNPETDASTLHLPQYTLGIDLNPQQRRVAVKQSVRWTNTGIAATDELVFQVVPNNKLTNKQIAAGERTVESLRLEPDHSIDYQGRRFHLTNATCAGNDLQARFDQQHDTHLHLQLPMPVAPGESVEVDLTYWIDIPPIMGRLGQHKGVTNLLNWYPVLAVYRGDEWQPVPYVAWHQPWHNEAGHYDVKLRLPTDHKVVTGGHIVDRSHAANGCGRIRGCGRCLASPRPSVRPWRRFVGNTPTAR